MPGFDIELWALAQRIVYPSRAPSSNPPFPREQTAPRRKPASFLYYAMIDARAAGRSRRPR